MGFVSGNRTEFNIGLIELNPFVLTQSNTANQIALNVGMESDRILFIVAQQMEIERTMVVGQSAYRNKTSVVQIKEWLPNFNLLINGDEVKLFCFLEPALRTLLQVLGDVDLIVVVDVLKMDLRIMIGL